MDITCQPGRDDTNFSRTPKDEVACFRATHSALPPTMASNEGELETRASITFIKPGSWPSTQKPYELLYVPTDGLPMSNFELETMHDIPVCDMRPSIDSLNLDQQGFFVAHLPTTLRYEDFWDETSLKDTYAAELRNLLLNRLQARSVFIHECVVCSLLLCMMKTYSWQTKLRKRSNNLDLESTGYGQPVSIAHTGKNYFREIN